MRAEAISARSIAANRRAKSGVLGANPIAAVLAMVVVPFLECDPVAASLSGINLCIPDTRDNRLVCIAAIAFCNAISRAVILPYLGSLLDSAAARNEKAAGFGGLFARFEGVRPAYSAACLRGGSRAPES